MDNGLIVLYLMLFAAAIIGISYVIALLIDKYKNESPNTSAKSSNTYEKWTPPKKDYSAVDKEIEEVVKWVGVSEPVDAVALMEKIIDGKEKEAIDEIAKQLSLPMKVIIRHGNEIHPSRLAEVKIGHLPGYGSRYLELYPCMVTLYPGYNSSPDRLISVVAHELSHYVLRSLRPMLPEEAKEERQTDLAVIFGGFKTSYNVGRKVANSTAGYLHDDEVQHVYDVYETMLADRRQKYEKISKGYSSLLEKQSDTLLFVKMCGLLLEHRDEKILDSDMASIGNCFSSVGKKEIEKIKKLTSSLDPFLKKKTRYSNMENDADNLAELEKILKEIKLPEASDISALMKYTDKYK